MIIYLQLWCRVSITLCLRLTIYIGNYIMGATVQVQLHLFGFGRSTKPIHNLPTYRV